MRASILKIKYTVSPNNTEPAIKIIDPLLLGSTIEKNKRSNNSRHNTILVSRPFVQDIIVQGLHTTFWFVSHFDSNSAWAINPLNSNY